MLTYCNRGLLYVQRNEPDKAIADYNRALQLKPDLVAAYDGRGNAYAKKKTSRTRSKTSITPPSWTRAKAAPTTVARGLTKRCTTGSTR